ncbi:MAG: hypothetical protein HOH24_02060 [Chromatiales bacterium]|nr:hypothetical protein [Chromatiales bacterium]
MKTRWTKFILLAAVCSLLTACDAPQVYGSVGMSSFGGYGGSSRMHGSIAMGGRIY